jgi:excisionase family DNA binding protein
VAELLLKVWLSTRQAAEHLGVQETTLQQWRHRRSKNLPYSKIGKIVRYRLADVEAFLAENIVDPRAPRPKRTKKTAA